MSIKLSIRQAVKMLIRKPEGNLVVVVVVVGRGGGVGGGEDEGE